LYHTCTEKSNAEIRVRVETGEAYDAGGSPLQSLPDVKAALLLAVFVAALQDDDLAGECTPATGSDDLPAPVDELCESTFGSSPEEKPELYDLHFH
jgi:hypothetical protein